MRRLIMLISMGGLPPYLCPSGAFLDLGTQCLKSSGALAISLLVKAVPRPGFLEWFARSVYGKGAQLAPAPGYVAPPLDGVWATSPSYLHNGSVPSIPVLLDSPNRPKYWTRTFDSKDYNPETLGWNYTELSYGKAGAKNKEERKRVYDTTLPGHSNQGHTFGDALSENERRALIEYLKTL